MPGPAIVTVMEYYPEDEKPASVRFAPGESVPLEVPTRLTTRVDNLMTHS
ncbi:hypothetical protein GCM10027160_27730 [Streptomyces calidiresistens]|uniref:Uncharacterized protein n=1 Tax=Streptomyces calidiresistens TaxID=1485586 RepID=A0A7W3T4W4_9ACTN|nr:hypothetical protein [Streptomyces calidiresistens]MBB0230833.1 hypothetical protein [Streptomyces calidiresistens]